MSYENPPVDHAVNVSRESVPLEFLRLGLGLALFMIAVGTFVYLCGGWLARFIPFSTEAGWVGDRLIGVGLFAPDERGPTGSTAALRDYLQTLADRLATKMDLPAGMNLHLHWSDSDVPNAFATLGGHIVVTSGLYRRMPSENALAVVLAHEIGHIKARDPISSIGGGASMGLALVLLGGDAGQLAPQMARLVQLGYSRRAESDADDAAIVALRAVYGHAGGADSAFAALAAFHEGSLPLTVPTLFSTHPADAQRLSRMAAAASDWGGRGELQPLAIKPDRWIGDD